MVGCESHHRTNVHPNQDHIVVAEISRSPRSTLLNRIQTKSASNLEASQWIDAVQIYQLDA